MFNSLQKLSVRHKLSLVAGANFLFVTLFYLAVILPQNEKIAEATSRNSAESQIVKRVELFAAHPNLAQFLTELDEKTLQVNTIFPNDIDMSAFLKQIELYARESGVHLSQVHTGQIVSKSSYREIPMEIVVQGSYLTTVTFVKKMEDGNRFILIRNMQMSSNNKELQQSASKIATGLHVGEQQSILTSKLSAVIFAYGVPKAKQDTESSKEPMVQQDAKK